MNRPPLFILERGGHWHRPNLRQLSTARGSATLCRETVTVAAAAFEDGPHVHLVCHPCEEIAEGKTRNDV